MHDMTYPTGRQRVTAKEQRVRAAVDEVVAATEPEQVVLFGSFARGSAGPDSDIDLLVIGDPERQRGGKRTCARTGDEVDVFITDRASAELRRYSAVYLEGIALSEGRTVYAKDGKTAIRTGERMIRRTLYDPDKAVEWVDEARHHLERFETDQRDAFKCSSLAAALERALKALIVAAGQRVAHRHGLEKLWTEAEEVGGRLPGKLTATDLEELTKYTGEFLYPPVGERELDPRATWEGCESGIREVVAHAGQRVPTRVKQTLAQIRREREDLDDMQG